MIYQVDSIVGDVRVCLDQNMVSDALLATGDIDTLSLDEIIRSKVREAVRRVHSEAPFHLLEEGHNFGDNLYWGDQCSGWVLLPHDFMRLVVFEMSDWERPVFEAITPADASYALQRSRFKGIRGTAQRPVCAIATRGEGKVLEFYSCKSEEATVSRAVYIPYPEIADGGIDICERCYDAVVYTVAGLTLLSCGEVEKATSLFELAKTYLQ